jgi:hypothetical protein
MAGVGAHRAGQIPRRATMRRRTAADDRL